MKIGVTMRVLEFEARAEVWDCVDQSWDIHLRKFGLETVLVPNSTDNVREFVSSNKIDGFILSGGNDLSYLEGAVGANARRDILETEILRLALELKLPVFGVCRGTQLINYFLGGKITRVSGHAGTHHQIHSVVDKKLEQSLVEVNSYHNWGIEPCSLGSGVTPLYLANDGTVEAISVVNLPWVGVMWHPEREAEFSDVAYDLFRGSFPSARRIST